MKIINGEYSGRNIFMPYGIRPTQNVLKKSLFDIIGQDLSGMTFLELFAGSGAIGFEALSCGASEVYFVEHNAKCKAVIEENLTILRPADRDLKAFVIQQDAYAAVKQFAREGKKFDVVFFDPPYGLKLAKKALKTLMTHDILAPHSFLVAQYHHEEKMPEVDESAGLTLVKDKLYGTSRLTIYERR
jgi:16S rRNA (guanine966-N2)-methyltransferase